MGKADLHIHTAYNWDGTTTVSAVLKHATDCTDLIVTGTDVMTQKILRGKRVVLVQEGMTEPEGLAGHLQAASERDFRAQLQRN
jgi:hypothetical protein